MLVVNKKLLLMGVVMKYPFCSHYTVSTRSIIISKAPYSWQIYVEQYVTQMHMVVNSAIRRFNNVAQQRLIMFRGLTLFEQSMFDHSQTSLVLATK